MKKSEKCIEQGIFKGRSPENGQKTYEEMLNLQAIKAMLMKTTLRFYLTPFRTAIIRVISSNKCGEDVGKTEHSYADGGNVN
jgi:hypothetical protein